MGVVVAPVNHDGGVVNGGGDKGESTPVPIGVDAVEHVGVGWEHDQFLSQHLPAVCVGTHKVKCGLAQLLHCGALGGNVARILRSSQGGHRGAAIGGDHPRHVVEVPQVNRDSARGTIPNVREYVKNAAGVAR